MSLSNPYTLTLPPPPSYTHTNNWSSYSVSCTSDMVVVSTGADLRYYFLLYNLFSPEWAPCCPFPCISLLTETPEQKTNPETPDPSIPPGSWGCTGGIMEPFATVKTKKVTRPGVAFTANRGNGINAAVFTEAAPGRVHSQTGGWG